MTRISKADRATDASEQLLVLATEFEASGGLASWPLAMPAFFLGWVFLGVLLAPTAHTSGQSRRQALAFGAGLGPLAAVVAVEARRRRRSARPLALASGVNHGGPLDILVLIQYPAADASSVVPTLEAVAADVGTLTLAQALPDAWLEGDSALDQAAVVLFRSRELVPIFGAAIVVFPDTSPEDVAHGFSVAGSPVLVLFATDDTAPVAGWW